MLPQLGDQLSRLGDVDEIRAGGALVMASAPVNNEVWQKRRRRQKIEICQGIFDFRLKKYPLPRAGGGGEGSQQNAKYFSQDVIKGEI